MDLAERREQFRLLEGFGEEEAVSILRLGGIVLADGLHPHQICYLDATSTYNFALFIPAPRQYGPIEMLLSSHIVI